MFARWMWRRNSALVLLWRIRSTTSSRAWAGSSAPSTRRSFQATTSSSSLSSSSSLRVEEASTSRAGKIRRSDSLRSRRTSMLPVPLNSSKITSSIREPVSTRAVASADRAHEVHDPRGDLGRVVLQTQALRGGERGQVLEVAAVAGLLGLQAVDLVDPGERGVLLGVARQLDRALDLVAAAQPHPPDHRQRHVHVVGARQVAVDPQEAVAVLGADVEGAGAGDLRPVVGALPLPVVGPVEQRHVAALLVELAVAVAVPVAVAAPAAAAALALLVLPAV